MSAPEILKCNYQVPNDVIPDISELITKHGIINCIRSIQRETNSVLIELTLEPRHKEVREMVERIIAYYNFHLYGKEEFQVNGIVKSLPGSNPIRI